MRWRVAFDFFKLCGSGNATYGDCSNWQMFFFLMTGRDNAHDFASSDGGISTTYVWVGGN